MNLTTPASVQKLQTALQVKAKESPSFRFYAVYDKVHRKDVLAFAYECCKANGGVGVENVHRCTGWGASRDGTPGCLFCGSLV